MAVLGLITSMNVLMYGYYRDRVYPGVSVGKLELGGRAISTLPQALYSVPKGANLHLKIDGVDQIISREASGMEIDVSGTVAQVTKVGHEHFIPMMGILKI